ncbi:unnamed protein product [Rotaria sp. Silwood1]|nr:unnamed protein product [Rotaria sp. Silwood1]CAF1238663.1 unnamed protein product [Rotaria sp. Silwood1]CAF3460152.1 unnamed protein product [Rotaria sp. Silwood1]CAF3498046.1 unnamed protein product [Rotaria sp. Silwood1]CAF4510921.1 unnamed protein product [Rotaria sp. Silwood1]
MDYNQQNSDGDNSTVTFKQPQNSLHLTLSTTSTLDSTSKKTNSLMISKQSNLNIDYAINRIKSLRKRYYQQQKQIEHCTSSHSTNTRSTLPSTTTIMKKTEKQQKSLKNFSKIQTQEARPLGICLRKCIQCRQFKHILLAECTVCYRMMDIDLKDCKCQIVTNKNIIDHFICSICNSELTLDEYIICANRTCQTTLSTLINKESMNEIEEKSVLSTILTNIYYPKSTHRTVAIQANTLINLPSVQKFLPTIIDDENEKSSSSMSWSKHDSDWTIITSPDSSDISSMSIDSNINVSLDNITRNVTAAFNSNQPTKLTLQSEDKLRQHQSQLTNTNDKIINNNLEFIEMPKSPRCLPIMNVHSRHDRLSTLLKLKKNEICQTQLSCLMDIDEMIRCDELVDPIVIRTNNLTHIERQIQVDTIRGRFHGLCQTRIEIDDRIEKDSTINLTNDDRILQALIDRDGQRWSELIDQLINEQSNFSLSDIAQQLLDTIERLYTTERLNNLTTGQLQRKVRYAMSQLKHIDENSYLRNNFKTTKTNHTNINSRKQTECNGTMDMAVTVRQIDKHQTTASPDHIWKSYVDRLFDQGHSANEIQRLLHKAAEKTMQCDDYRLQDVFNYINTKTKQQRAKTAPSKIAFIASSPKTIPVTSEQSQSTNLFQSIKFNKTLDNSSKIMICPSTSISARKEMSNELSSTFINKDQRSTTERTKNKSSSSNTSLNTNLIKSSSIEPNIIQIESTENKFITDLNKNEKERNLSLHSSIDHEHVNIMVKSSLATMNKQQSIANRGSSTTRITSVTDMPLTNFEEKSIDALHHVENTHLHEHSLNIPFELNKLIDIIFESNLRKPDNIEILMTKCIELLTNEEQIIVPQLEEVHSQHMNEAISNTLNLLQEYKKLTMPFIINYEDLSYNRHISNMIKISSDSQISLKLVNENMEQTIESSSQPIQSDIDLDLKKQVNTSEYQETVSSIEYRPMSYTVSNEKGSTESSRQDFICSTNHISLKTKELDEELVTNKNDLNNISDIPLKIESELYDDLSLKQWLDALLSKLSDNISRTSIIDQTKINVKDKQESIIMKPVDEHVSSLNEQRSKSSISIKERTTNMIETTDDKHNIQYVTDVIMLKKEYAMSIIIPDQIFSMIDEHFQLVETKLLQTKVATDSKQILKSNDQLLSSVNEENIEHVNKELSNFNYDFDDKFQTSSFATLLHANHVDEEKQSISFVVNDETPSITGRSSAPSDIDLSEQLNQLQIHEWSVSPKQLVPSDLSESKEKFESSQKILPMFESEDIVLSKTDMNFVPEINTESSPSNDQEEEKEKTKSILSFSSEDNEHESLIETNEPHIDIITSSKSSHINKQVFDEHTSITASIVFNHQNEISKLQLPVSTKYFSTSNDIQSNSFLIHLNHQTSTIPHKKSISNHTPMLNEEKNSPINSHDQNLVIETSIQNSEDKKLSSEKIDNVTTNHFHESTILSLNHNITPQSVKSILYPSKTTVNTY